MAMRAFAAWPMWLPGSRALASSCTALACPQSTALPHKYPVPWQSQQLYQSRAHHAVAGKSCCSSAQQGTDQLAEPAGLGRPAHDPSASSTEQNTPIAQRKFLGLDLAQWTVAASVLCAIDCTVLPAITAALPFIDALPAEYAETAHSVTKKLSLYFVAPVGSFAVGSAFLQHRQPHIAGLGMAGVAALVLSHMPNSPIPCDWHTMSSVTGCAALLGSQAWAKKWAPAACCTKPEVPGHAAGAAAPARPSSTTTHSSHKQSKSCRTKH